MSRLISSSPASETFNLRKKTNELQTFSRKAFINTTFRHSYCRPIVLVVTISFLGVALKEYYTIIDFNGLDMRVNPKK